MLTGPFSKALGSSTSTCRTTSRTQRYELIATPPRHAHANYVCYKDTDAFTARADERTIQAQVQELMCYIWDNYLQLYDTVEDIFLMGVGNAYLGIKVLLINRRTPSISLPPNPHRTLISPPMY